MVKHLLKTALFITCFSAVQAIAQLDARDSIEGSWEGPLVYGRDNWNFAFTFSRNEEGYGATLTSGGMGIYGMPANEVIIEDRNIIVRIPRLDLEFTGTMRLGDDDKIIRIDGDWFQYSEMVPVVLLPVESPTF